MCWTDLIKVLVDNEVEKFIEVGPKNVLVGLIKNIVSSATLVNVGDVKTLQQITANS